MHRILAEPVLLPAGDLTFAVEPQRADNQQGCIVLATGTSGTRFPPTATADGSAACAGVDRFAQLQRASRHAVESVAKAGTTGIIGVYPPTMLHVPIGQAMNKNLTLKMGNCNHRRYIPALVDLAEAGTVTPTKILTQREPLTDVIAAYQACDIRQPGWVKVELIPAA